MIVLFATIVSALQFTGGQASVAKGVLDGLQPGDRGRVYYLLSVNRQEIRFDSTWASVTSCQDALCSLALDQKLEPGDGYYFELEVSEERFSAATLSELARQRLADRDFDGAERILSRIQSDVSAGRPASRVHSEISDLRSRVQKGRRRGELLTRASSALRERDFSRFAEILLLLEGSRDAISDKVSPLRESFDEMRGERMIRIEAGTYSIGEDIATARFYNQSPRFRKSLHPFWLDRWPVTQNEYSSNSEQVPASGAPQTSASFVEARAYCESVGKRLPTEFELEVAVSENWIPPAQITEWTSSWYLPYPGNERTEDEFGQTYRVLKGWDSGRRQDVRQRLFMLPTDQESGVGFRCASDDIPR